MFAACAVAFATAVSAPGATPAGETRAIQKIERYCTTSWRNAGIRPQEWEDCTQQALVELLSSMPSSELLVAIEQPESEARRELNRAVWRLVQRSRRQVKDVALVESSAESRVEADYQDDWRAIELAADELLSPRQQRILEWSRSGWRVSDIASELNVSSERISDEKYKAITKLRERLSQA
jgi:DNA-directed RNA polymerase specialized sigma24 family protein